MAGYFDIGLFTDTARAYLQRARTVAPPRSAPVAQLAGYAQQRGAGAALLAGLGMGAVTNPSFAAFDAGSAVRARGTAYGILAITGAGAGPATGNVNATFTLQPGSFLWLRPRGAISADLTAVFVNGRNVPVAFAGAVLPGDFLEVGSFHATGFLVPDGVPAQANLRVDLDLSGAGTVDVVFVGQSDDAVRALQAQLAGCR